MDPLAVPGVALVCAVDAAVRVVVFDAVLLPCVLQDTNAKLARQRIRAAIRRASFKSCLLFLSLSWGRTDTNMFYLCCTTWCITFLAHVNMCKLIILFPGRFLIMLYYAITLHYVMELPL